MREASRRRLAALRAALAASRPPLDALLVTGAANRRYLSGFTGSAGLLVVTPAEALLLTDFRYAEQAGAEAPGWTVVETGQEPLADLRRCLVDLGVRRVGFEAEHVSVAQRERWQEAVPAVEWVPTAGLVERLRQVKDADEQAAIRRAAAVAAAAFEAVLPLVRPGVRERDLALELEYHLRRQGAEAVAFEVIVASGPRAALPHARPGDRRLEPGDAVIFDFGAVVDGYCSDCTRTVAVGRAGETLRHVHALVREAQRAALEAVRAGVEARTVDAAARSRIEAAGYGERFGHATGHGVGLEVHEAPRLGRGSQDVLAAGMVVTVEPGVYLPGQLGVRIEDLVVVGEDGGEVLTPTTRELLEL